ncbi:MAG: flagellar FliJ family protein [Oscillospiraceae bacterium]|nr:flagellar FliJ family protein [Oscillospiraceae bacterium]
MKRFRFQLEPVLDFKQQSLDALLIELNTVQAQVAAQERARDAAFQTLADYDADAARRRAEGMTIVEAMECEVSQRVLVQRAQREEEKLKLVRREAERKRQEVVEARKETHSLEKLKDLRRSEYDFAAAKAEEKALDDLTAARRSAAV